LPERKGVDKQKHDAKKDEGAKEKSWGGVTLGGLGRECIVHEAAEDKTGDKHSVR